ncbi:hypothetical protein VP01_3296g1 [Puccinia sorghi]|uniref:Uncharacterized protein n=1 Tax=Puccinia sorghi TaxID=27349 RepID=A0A0L6UYF6_9BASI|nr:hypothetical protein VP01_3296g1 [Puccinia sorghi]
MGFSCISFLYIFLFSLFYFFSFFSQNFPKTSKTHQPPFNCLTPLVRVEGGCWNFNSSPLIFFFCSPFFLESLTLYKLILFFLFFSTDQEELMPLPVRDVFVFLIQLVYHYYLSFFSNLSGLNSIHLSVFYSISFLTNLDQLVSSIFKHSLVQAINHICSFPLSPPPSCLRPEMQHLIGRKKLTFLIYNSFLILFIYTTEYLLLIYIFHICCISGEAQEVEVTAWQLRSCVRILTFSLSALVSLSFPKHVTHCLSDPFYALKLFLILTVLILKVALEPHLESIIEGTLAPSSENISPCLPLVKLLYYPFRLYFFKLFFKEHVGGNACLIGKLYRMKSYVHSTLLFPSAIIPHLLSHLKKLLTIFFKIGSPQWISGLNQSRIQSSHLIIPSDKFIPPQIRFWLKSVQVIKFYLCHSELNNTGAVPLVISAIPLVISAIPLVISAIPLVISAIPLLISAIPLVISVIPLVITAQKEFTFSPIFTKHSQLELPSNQALQEQFQDTEACGAKADLLNFIFLAQTCSNPLMEGFEIASFRSISPPFLKGPDLNSCHSQEDLKSWINWLLWLTHVYNHPKLLNWF